MQKHRDKKFCSHDGARWSVCLCYAYDRDWLHADWYEDDCYWDCYEDDFVGDYCELSEDGDDDVFGVETNGNDCY